MRRLTRRQRIVGDRAGASSRCASSPSTSAAAALRDAHGGVRGSARLALPRHRRACSARCGAGSQGVPSAGTQRRPRSTRCASENADAARPARGAAGRRGARAGAARPAAARGRRQRHTRSCPARVIAFGPGRGLRLDGDPRRRHAQRRARRPDRHRRRRAGRPGAARRRRQQRGAAGRRPRLGRRACATPRTGELGVATGQGADGFTFAPLNPNADGPASATSW